MSQTPAPGRRFRRPPPTPDTTCPACGGGALVAGTFDGRGPNAFHLDGARFWTLGPIAAPIDRDRSPAPAGIAGPYSGRAQACTDCGLVWLHVDPARLRKVVEASGKPAIRAALERAKER